MTKLAHQYRKELLAVGVVAALVAAYFILPPVLAQNFQVTTPPDVSTSTQDTEARPADAEASTSTVAHQDTPDQVKGVYMSACAAASPQFRENFISLLNETELNSIIIDIKDYTGTISFPAGGELAKINSDADGCRYSKMQEFIKRLHEMDVYVIGRITAFQDPYYTTKNKSVGIKKQGTDELWADKEGLHYIDPGAKQAWEYLTQIGKASHRIGFDELNYDYIRYPSDGDTGNMQMPTSAGKKKRAVLKSFFSHLDSAFKDTGAVLSADLFGMTTTNSDDLNIGQVLEDALAHFDYVAPMVYPSHYPPGFIGLKEPAAEPYEVIGHTMNEAVTRIDELSWEPTYSTSTTVQVGTTTSPATTTKQTPPWPQGTDRADAVQALSASQKKRISKEQLRPWIQDFDLGADYTPEMVRAQIQATYDVGLDSWMLWDPSNTYTREALESASSSDEVSR